MKLAVRPWKWAIPKGKDRIGTTIFKGRTVGFREGNATCVPFSTSPQPRVFQRWHWKACAMRPNSMVRSNLPPGNGSNLFFFGFSPRFLKAGVMSHATEILDPFRGNQRIPYRTFFSGGGISLLAVAMQWLEEYYHTSCWITSECFNFTVSRITIDTVHGTHVIGPA